MTEAEQLDHTPLTFGKYVGKTPNEVSEMGQEACRWLVWAFNNVKDKPTCSKLLADACEEDMYE